MGDRGQIVVRENAGKPVYLYAHNKGWCLRDILKAALAKRARWDDAPYLTRIIFSEMVKGHEDSYTGFGISASAFRDASAINIDVGAQTVDGVSFETFIAPDLFSLLGSESRS